MRRNLPNGFTLVELLLVVSLIGVLATMAIPNYVNLRAKAYDASALSAGRNAQILMEVSKKLDSTYANDLDVLLRYEKNLTDDPMVTFEFGSINNSSYVFTTIHAKGKQTYTFRD